MRDDSFTNAMEIDNQALTLDITPCHNLVGLGANVKETQVCATLAAADLPDDSQRAPVDIGVALDVSGSMSGDKLELCKKTLEMILRQLTPKDTFALVSFSDNAVIEFPSQKMTKEAKASAISKVKSLSTLGSTNISAAIGMVSQELFSVKNPNEVRSVLLLTDGLANQGITKCSGLVELARNCLSRSGAPPVTMHCFGYGSGHDDSLLRELSTCTLGGSYYFVENDSAVATAFGDALGGILSVVAQNAVLSVTVPEVARAQGVKILEVSHEHKMRISDYEYKVTVGDFYAEESRDVLFLVRLSDSQMVGPHVEVSVSYTDTLSKTPASIASVGCSIGRPEGKEVSQPNDHVRIQWLRVFTAQELAKANELSRQNNMGQAKATLATAKARVQQDKGLQGNPTVTQLLSDLGRA
eukprot:CAMPEP_0194069514 /NCGR_PEP_ID=MMETSP0009_2-20130614/87679_1 /TAXON_ID=210454 /ORGANISM="Grammatophora oceanica, Strain CCMP 410" /LENGTH=412 /DNA_ID=CAMNT_0038722705 /DNA_START=559 /DNA_END=1793 /DNA_ORIENTATION=+